MLVGFGPDPVAEPPAPGVQRQREAHEYRERLKKRKLALEQELMGRLEGDKVSVSGQSMTADDTQVEQVDDEDMTSVKSANYAYSESTNSAIIVPKEESQPPKEGSETGSTSKSEKENEAHEEEAPTTKLDTDTPTTTPCASTTTSI